MLAMAESVVSYDAELLSVVFKLSPVQANLLCLLLSRLYIPSKQLATAVADSAVAVHRLNNKLRSFGATVSNRRGHCYLIEAESRAAINQQMQRFQDQPVR